MATGSAPPRPCKVGRLRRGRGNATTIGVLVALALASVLGESVSLGSPSSNGSLGHIIQYLMVGLLIFLAVKSYLGRETAEPPRWMGALQNADPRRAFTTGLLLIWVMPSDLIIMLTVGVNLAHNGVSPVAALPFVAATALVAALPLLAYLLFRRRAKLLGTHGRWIPACARTGEHK